MPWPRRILITPWLFGLDDANLEVEEGGDVLLHLAAAVQARDRYRPLAGDLQQGAKAVRAVDDGRPVGAPGKAAVPVVQQAADVMDILGFGVDEVAAEALLPHLGPGQDVGPVAAVLAHHELLLRARLLPLARCPGRHRSCAPASLPGARGSRRRAPRPTARGAPESASPRQRCPGRCRASSS